MQAEPELARERLALLTPLVTSLNPLTFPLCGYVKQKKKKKNKTTNKNKRNMLP
jgi:hypothetical protein